MGLNEEDVAEVGGSLCFPSFALSMVRFCAGITNIVVSIWFLSSTTSDIDLQLLWSVPLRPRALSVEFFALAYTGVAYLQLSFVSSQYSRATARTDLFARIACPVAYIASTLGVFAVLATPWSWPPSKWRLLLHIPPLAALLLDVVFGARIQYRLRAIWLPLLVIHLQIGGALAFTAARHAATLTQMNAVRFLGLCLATSLLSAVCGLLVALVSWITHLCEHRTNSKLLPIIEYPVSPQRIAPIDA